MVDVFEEVEGQLRSERYRALALRAAPWAAGLLVLALIAAAAVWGYDYWRTRSSAKASETYDAALQLAEKGDNVAAFTKFGEVAEAGAPGYKALALMQQGGLRASEGKHAEAVQFYDQAAEAANNPLIEDLARLKSAYSLLDEAPYPDLEKRLTPLTQDDRPYYVLAREALALAKLRTGKIDEARSDFQVLGLLADASETVQQRAQAAVAMIDSGQAKTLAATVKAAAALPPAAATAPAAPSQPTP